MTARATYTTSVAAAVTTQVATIAAAQIAFQEAVNASGCNVGYTTQTGNYANFAAAVKAANVARLASINAAETARQMSVSSAKSTLRATGDLAAT